MKKTIGQQILEHDQLRLSLDDDVSEYRKPIERDVMKDIRETAERAAQHELYKGKPFYVVLLKYVDRALRIPRFKTIARKSCPSPTYLQSVWKVHVHGGLEYLWTLPDQLLYYHIVNNPQEYLQDKECHELAKFVLLDNSKELLAWVKKENGEKIDAIIRNIPQEDECLIN